MARFHPAGHIAGEGPSPHLAAKQFEEYESLDPKALFERAMRQKPPIANRAVQALWVLVENPPIKKRGGPPFTQDVEAWQLWYERVKAGNQTFRFHGDSTEYDLHGPASKQKLDRINRHQARDSQRAKGRSDIASTESKTSADSSGKSGVPVTIGILAALLLLGSAIWYWKKSNR